MPSLMNHRRTGFAPRALAALMLIALLALTGCGDDDDDNGPTGPTNPQVSDFDQATAVAQAQAAAPQGVALVESMSAMAEGYNKSYGWNPETQRWESSETWSQSGYTYNWSYTVQYLDAGGNPQQEASGAASVRHTMNGTGSYALDQGGASFQYDFLYTYDTTMTGLGTDTLVLQGSGETDIDYTYVGNGVNVSDTYALSWQTLGNGVSFPTSGCPSGTIRYDLAPYRMDLVFDGQGNATGTLYDGGGSVVAGGGSSYQVSCGK